MSVLPMGFSWAMYFSQKAHEAAIAEVPKILSSQFVSQGRPAPEAGPKIPPAVLAYADNDNFFGCDKDAVQVLKDQVVTLLRARSLPVREELDASSVAVVLGVKIDGM
eukprot:11073644-Heterocapsa_arctica.AAC.1